MYVRYTATHSRNNRCHGNATIRSPFLFSSAYMNVFSLVMELVPLAPLSSYKILCTTANSIKH